MKTHHCPRCQQPLLFEQEQCLHCCTSIAFDIWQLQIQLLDGVEACANRESIGCNWSADNGSRILPLLQVDPDDTELELFEKCPALKAR